MTVLSIDTAGPVVGVALSTGAVFQQRIVRGAEVAIAQALAELLPGQEIDLVCVSVGPGAFTSLRVGVAAALGIALARQVPVLPMCSLGARALMAPKGRVLAILDGRKSKAYAALYQDSECVEGPGDMPPDQALAMAKGQAFVAIGEGALVWQESIVAAGGRVHPQAGHSPVQAMCVQAQLLREQAVSPQSIRLRYLRDADAKLPSR